MCKNRTDSYDKSALEQTNKPMSYMRMEKEERTLTVRKNVSPYSLRSFARKGLLPNWKETPKTNTVSS